MNKTFSTSDYLERVNRALEEFQVSREVHDREVFYQFLEQVHSSTGNLLLLFGGKSVGKSLVLRDFAAKLDDTTNMWPWRVDARDFAGRISPSWDYKILQRVLPARIIWV
jgi:hypothetical protein